MLLQKGQITDLVDQPLELALKQIADVCERGLANAYGSDETSRARWTNVAKMCQVSLLPAVPLSQADQESTEHDSAYEARHCSPFLDHLNQVISDYTTCS